MSTPALPSASDLKQQALSLFRSGQITAARHLLLDALGPSQAAASQAIAELAEANASAAPLLDILSAALQAAPEQARLLLAAGRVAMANNQPDQAIAHFRQACRYSPDNTDHALTLGAALARANRPLEALPHLRHAHALQPSAMSMRVLADAEFDANHPEQAQPLYAALLANQPDDLVIRLRLAETWSQLADSTRALTLLHEALPLSPDAPDLHMALAQAWEDAGESQKAESAYETALRARPGWAIALAGLIGVRGAKTGQPLLDQARVALESPTTPPMDKAPLGYALGKALDRQGRYADAMHAWDIANTARERTAGVFNPASVSQHLKALEAAHASGLPARTTSSPSPRMIFIVGMPRSGTTLTERMLSAHPLVHGCGELPDLPRIALELGQDWPARLARLSDEELEAMKADYLRSARRNAPAEAEAFVDKAPLNFFQLGLALTLFPDARVIWCRRDRRDVALSIYSENFSPASTFATSLAGIAAYQDADDALLGMWQRNTDAPILVQEYEDLALAPEDGARRLLHFAGLEWHPDVMRSHEVAGTVQTPSRWQVREPIHTRSIGRWRNYPDRFDGLSR